jgi:hypothetical protein
MGFGPASRHQACFDFGLPLSSPIYNQHPFVGCPLRGLALFLSVPHPLPLTVICCFFFSSTDAILLSKLCLSSVLSGWTKVGHVVTLRIRIPLSRARAPHSLIAVVIKTSYYLFFTQSTLRLSLLGYHPFPHAFFVVLLPSTSFSPMIGV